MNETKQYLQGYRNATNKANRYRERIAQIENTLLAVNMDGQPRGGGLGDPTMRAAVSLATLKEELKAAEIEAQTLAQRIADEIERVPDEKSRELLFCRYILLMRWEDVARTMNKFRPFQEYETKHITGYLHQKALRDFEEANKWDTTT